MSANIEMTSDKVTLTVGLSSISYGYLRDQIDEAIGACVAGIWKKLNAEEQEELAKLLVHAGLFKG